MNTPAMLTVRWFESIGEVDREQWDKLAQSLSTPLLEWQWLHHLEASGSISSRFGWQPYHLTVWDQQELVGAAPLYLKIHSGGEFVFDHWLAQMATEYGIKYYPKMVGMSPATPSVGYQFLLAEGCDQAAVMQTMLSAIDQFCEQKQLSGCHLLFVNLPAFSEFASHGFTPWRHQSYLWENVKFSCFADYLSTFNSSQRRNIRRERRSMEKHGIEIRALTGNEITPDLAPLMYRFYLKTNERYGQWAARFLNGEFFERIFQDYRHRMLIVAAYARQSSVPLALSMLLVKDRHLIGRYWGCEEPVKDLHFNMCFYAPIQWAIENGIQTFDPGAGSPHKLLRGFRAVSNTSLHRFYDQRLKFIFEHCIDEINSMEGANIDALNLQLPFARNN
ncbi:GNAT family N-acetyltransferase [Desulfosediminicola flagellatus]|uniref:GNAT family N-acetyltransferase n=1 Tax=Desulfosediminicola flagellatus TaxID=2569541 RepID=UPI0010ABA77D|nr:GNAT family N-acetyltransferase [Desulfosediminicola flagellatus]